VTAGQRFFLYGTGLTGAGSDHLYLLSAEGTETDITSWILSRETTRLEVQLPANPPEAGVYQLQVGNELPLADPSASRSNSTPFSIAAWVDPGVGAIVTSVPNTPITLTGNGFVADKTEVLLGRIRLAPVSGNLAAGQFQVVNPTNLQLQLPDTIAPGHYLVRVRVNQVDTVPAKWVEVT
jgi:hypothetical protein